MPKSIFQEPITTSLYKRDTKPDQHDPRRSMTTVKFSNVECFRVYRLEAKISSIQDLSSVERSEFFANLCNLTTGTGRGKSITLVDLVEELGSVTADVKADGMMDAQFMFRKLIEHVCDLVGIPRFEEERAKLCENPCSEIILEPVIVPNGSLAHQILEAAFGKPKNVTP